MQWLQHLSSSIVRTMCCNRCMASWNSQQQPVWAGTFHDASVCINDARRLCNGVSRKDSYTSLASTASGCSGVCVCCRSDLLALSSSAHRSGLVSVACKAKGLTNNAWPTASPNWLSSTASHASKLCCTNVIGGLASGSRRKHSSARMYESSEKKGMSGGQSSGRSLPVRAAASISRIGNSLKGRRPAMIAKSTRPKEYTSAAGETAERLPWKTSGAAQRTLPPNRLAPRVSTRLRPKSSNLARCFDP
mmetsp:Transcript_14097/g.41842  ORF Transcript_14097/g.41842 Transcript_14097/m.41842 type:complete len:248 (+) Transcript_14097:463-1206(+)